MSWIPRGPTVTNHQATIARSDGKNHDKLPVMKFGIKKTFQPLNVNILYILTSQIEGNLCMLKLCWMLAMAGSDAGDLHSSLVAEVLLVIVEVSEVF